MKREKDKEYNKIDWMITLLPLGTIIVLCILFFFMPEQSNTVVSQIRFVLGDTFGTYYLVIGLGVFLISLFVAGSKYGRIVLGGQDEKPKYSFFAWGSMMFTAGLAADILFYSFSEWILYATDPHIAELGSIQDWASVYPVFHWSLIPWGFYLVLAVAFGFMLHVRKRDSFWVYAACKKERQAEIFGSLSTNSGKTYRWNPGETDRFVSCIRSDCRNSNHVQPGNASDGQCDQCPVWSGIEPGGSDDRNTNHNLHCVHVFPAPWI